MGLRKRKKQQEAEESGFGSDVGRLEPQGRSRLTPADVQQKVFRLAFRGYNEKDVDEFLDIVTEDLAALHQENKRLREGAGAGSEEALREAREEAERIIADAQRRAGLADVAGGATAPPSFLIREREFLQQMAALVQGHTAFLKEEARRAKAGAGAAPSGEPAPAPEPVLEATAPMEAVSKDAPGDAGWDNPFAEPEAGAAFPDEGSALEGFGPEGGDEEEPSLRELFWGEE